MQIPIIFSTILHHSQNSNCNILVFTSYMCAFPPVSPLKRPLVSENPIVLPPLLSNHHQGQHSIVAEAACLPACFYFSKLYCNFTKWFFSMCVRERGKGERERGRERKTERERDSQKAYGGFTSGIVHHWKVKDALQVINEWKQFLNIVLSAAHYTHSMHQTDRQRCRHTENAKEPTKSARIWRFWALATDVFLRFKTFVCWSIL